VTTHKYFMKGIPMPLWKEFRLACIYFDTTAKEHLLSCMQSLVLRYHRRLQEAKTGPAYEHHKKVKK